MERKGSQVATSARSKPKTNSERQAAYRARRRFKGLCARPGCSSKTPAGLCPACRQADADRKQERKPEVVRQLRAEHADQVRYLENRIAELECALQRAEWDLQEARAERLVTAPRLPDTAGPDGLGFPTCTCRCNL